MRQAELPCFCDGSSLWKHCSAWRSKHLSWVRPQTRPLVEKSGNETQGIVPVSQLKMKSSVRRLFQVAYTCGTKMQLGTSNAWNRALLDKLVVAQLVDKLLAFVEPYVHYRIDNSRIGLQAIRIQSTPRFFYINTDVSSSLRPDVQVVCLFPSFFWL
jgi:hypothetical protein